MRRHATPSLGSTLRILIYAAYRPARAVQFLRRGRSGKPRDNLARQGQRPQSQKRDSECYEPHHPIICHLALRRRAPTLKAPIARPVRQHRRVLASSFGHRMPPHKLRIGPLRGAGHTAPRTIGRGIKTAAPPSSLSLKWAGMPSGCISLRNIHSWSSYDCCQRSNQL